MLTKDAFRPAANFVVRKPSFFAIAQDDGRREMSRGAHYGQVS
jgi:hypothetical protein